MLNISVLNFLSICASVLLANYQQVTGKLNFAQIGMYFI